MASFGAHDVPAEFRHALDSIRNTTLRAEMSLDETPGPARLASYTAAFLADAIVDGEELATGRLVLLYEPDGHEAWEGTFRIVTYVRAALEPEMAADPLLPSVGWAWLVEALDARGATYVAPSGTVTRVASESFGAMSEEPPSGEIEIRASWSPVGPDLAPHVTGWGDLVCQTAGLPPLPEGVAALPTRGLARRGAHPARP